MNLKLIQPSAASLEALLPDWGLWLLAAPLAYALAYGSAGLADATGDDLIDWPAALTYVVIGAVVKVVALSWGDLSRHRFQFFSTAGVLGAVRTVVGGQLTLLVLAALMRLTRLGTVPLSVPLIELLLALSLLLGVRFTQRLWAEQRRREEASKGGQRTVILGAGDAGQLIAREMLRQNSPDFCPVGFLDDNPLTHHQLISGLPVLGPLRGQIAALSAAARAQRLIIALPSESGERIREIYDEAKATGLSVQIMPNLSELLMHRPQLSQLREVNLADLLRRPPSVLTHTDIGAYLTGQTVLVTGAGGSIGSELVRQVSRYSPGHLILLGRGENSIFAIQQELREHFPEVRQTAIIGDVRHAKHLRQVFGRYQPQVVLHAAAHKHVPLMEDSPSEAIYNNVIGTRIVASLCLEFGVRRFVSISSDKAVNPTSVMGASKRLAEMIISVAAQRTRPEQAFMSVRFGNVLGSRGSVVPTFMRQIQSGGPITITDERMTRYFMTIPEAARLVLQAGAMAGNGKVYVLKMGQPVRIVDLARDLMRLSGHEVEITYSGVRPGEKLYEELLTDSERVDQTSHQEIFVARLDTPDPEWLREELARLEAYASEEDYPHIREQIRRMIPESQVAQT